MYKSHYLLLQCIDDLLKKSGKKAPADHAAVWIPDAETNTCMHCKKVQFTLVNRRHHCRSEPVLQIYLLDLCLIRYSLASSDLFYLRFFLFPVDCNMILQCHRRLPVSIFSVKIAALGSLKRVTVLEVF